MAAAMVFSLAACGGSGGSSDEGGSDDAAEGKDASEIKVGIVTDTGGVNDGSFNQWNKRDTGKIFKVLNR